MIRPSSDSFTSRSAAIVGRSEVTGRFHLKWDERTGIVKPSPSPSSIRPGSMIPRVAHFVFGLTEQDEPLHPVHFMAVESCRRILEPEAIYLHYKHLPFGPYWDRLRPHLTLVEVDLVDEVLAADYSGGHVPEKYRYAHHADFVRLDALIEHGGVYADMDTIFLRPFPDDLFDEPFVIGREPPVIHERTGERRR